MRRSRTRSAKASTDPGGLPQRWLFKALVPLRFGRVLQQQLALQLRLLDPAPAPHGAAPTATTAFSEARNV